MFFAISSFFELLCVLLYAFIFPKLPIVKYYRSKAASEGSKTVSADLAAGGVQTLPHQEVCLLFGLNQNQTIPPKTGIEKNHLELMFWVCCKCRRRRIQSSLSVWATKSCWSRTLIMLSICFWSMCWRCLFSRDSYLRIPDPMVWVHGKFLSGCTPVVYACRYI